MTRTTPYEEIEPYNGTIHGKPVAVRLMQTKETIKQWDKEHLLSFINIRSLPSRALIMQSYHSLVFNFTHSLTLERPADP